MIKLGSSAIVLGKASSSGSSTFVGLSDKAAADIPTINVPLATALGDKEAAANKKIDINANKTSDTFFPTIKAVFDWVSSLFVKGVSSSTDNAVARFDGTTGKVLQSSSVSITDDGAVILPVNVISIRDSLGASMFSSGGGTTNLYSNAAGLSIYGYPASSPIFVAAASKISRMTSPDLQIWSDSTPSRALKLNVSPTGSSASFNYYNGVSWGASVLELTNTGVKIPASLIDNVGSSGADGQVLKKVGGQVLWANP